MYHYKSVKPQHTEILHLDIWFNIYMILNICVYFSMSEFWVSLENAFKQVLGSL